MKTKTHLSKRLVSIAICIAMLMVYLPLATVAAGIENGHFDRTVDANTMDNWKKYFDLDHLDTSNAGGVWTDKSVFTDASAFPGSVKMIDSNKNFLTALSALAANKEVVGYSTVPTDTVFILDLSNSMTTNSVTQLVNATNNAIAKLQQINNNNRVGVVLYSGSSSDRSYNNAVASLMPIDRYSTTDSQGKYITFSNSRVSLDDNVRGSKGTIQSESKSHGGATYIQAGLWEAYKMFDQVPDSEIVIGDNNWQAGEYRMPIVVLMSDGAPTLGASNFADVEDQTYYGNAKGANVGDGNDSNITAGQGFLVQLTASYIKNRIENKYKVHTENGTGRSLFYTLGFNLNSISNNTARNVALSVLNPDATTVTDTLWTTFNNKNSNTMQVTVEGMNGNNTNVTITKNSYATSKSYVDEYFSASGNGLSNAFDDITEEIILQSRYYPTHLEGGSPDFSGYVEFTDTLGEYMEVKNITGILLGNTLFDGHMMASRLFDTGADGLGTPENPTALGNEFIRAVKTRLGIANTSDAQALVVKAVADGQLKYNSAADWSNYIAWYAKADGSYIGFYDNDGTESVPSGAVYINRSYGFLGETTGSIKNSDMMYMSVQVRTNIETGEQTVSWKIPASLVPMVTYLVTLNGSNVDTATNVSVTVNDKNSVTPIRLIYETGLRSDLNEFNITRIAANSMDDGSKTDENHIHTDGHTRLFWNNHFDVTAASHDEHVTALAEFTPNKENERFYYTFDSAVYKKSGSDYVLVQNGTLDANGEYYHRRYIFRDNATKPQFIYEKMSAASIKAAQWQDQFETLDHQTTGAYVVPKGTPARELQMYDEQKTANSTSSAKMVFHPYLSEQNNTVYVDMNLGNNGLLAVTPATGIKISKTVDIFEPGTSDTFKFRLTAAAGDNIMFWLTQLDTTPEGTGITASLTNGVYEFELKKDQTLWITGIPAGTAYTVEELSGNDDYKVKSVHVNGEFTGHLATGTISQYLIDDVDFVNTVISEGDLVITKQVVDTSGNVVNINNEVKFTAEITLTDKNGSPVSGIFASSAGNIELVNGKYTAMLSGGESFVIRGIPEQTRYTIAESNIPMGFALHTEASQLSGVIDTTTNDQALIVNTYDPVGTNGQSVTVQVFKEIIGDRTNWLNGESYTFRLEKLDAASAAGTVIGNIVIDSADTVKSDSLTLAGETYTTAGTYYYRIVEVVGSQGGMIYDTAERRFSVVVADADMDGDLEIIAVNNELNTSIAPENGGWRVSGTFRNVYMASGTASATVHIQKDMIGNHTLSGYQFVLYDADPSVNANANEIIRSALTDAAGRVSITLSYSAADAGQTFTYYLAELGRGETVNNIKYSEEVYRVDVTIQDNQDGTISAMTVIRGLPQGFTTPTFTNAYVPSVSDYVVISGRKEIVGDRILNANEFEFVITPLTPNAPMPAATTVKNAADGSFYFPAIEFADVHKNNTYVYQVTERSDVKIDGFTYDSTVYTVTVTVTDNGDQTITATAVISNGIENVENILFRNVYEAASAKVDLTGIKLLTGKTLEAGEFEFVISRVTENAPMPFANTAKNTATNDAKGVINLGTIEFTKKGVYVYTISETDKADTRYDCDKSVYTLTVTVTDNSQGVLSANVVIEKNGLPSTEIVFRNSFVPAPIVFDIHTEFVGEGVKVLDGRTLDAGEFEFALINAINGVQIGETVKNDGNGKFKFPAVTLRSAGIHHYKIVEIIGDKKGVSYDTSSYHIRLVVVQGDSGILTIADKQLYKGVVSKQEIDGVLTEVTTYENITGAEVKFNNIYKTAPAYVTLEATKTLIGRDLADGEFKFDLHKTDSTYAYNENTLVQNDVVLKLQNNGTGSIVFAPESFHAADTYYFVIVEDELDEKGVTADRTVYKVEINVTDDREGSLVATMKVNGQAVDGSTADAVKFQNTYEAKATEILIKGTKTLNGRDLVAEEFSFDLYDKDGKKLETVKNAADGSFAFKAIPVDKAGEYVYTVVEQQGSAEGITYDTATYTVKVSVIDNLDGTFKAVYTYLNGSTPVNGVTFTNVYTAPEPAPEPVIPENPKTGDTIYLNAWFVMVALCGLGFLAIYVLSRKKEEV